MTDINFLAQIAYNTGTDPIDYAVTNVIQSHIEVFLATRDIHADFLAEAGRPLGHRLMTTDALSRHILADLLNAGWTPPTLASEPGP